MFAPEESYERHRDVDKAVFPRAYTVALMAISFGSMMDGAADTSIALAAVSIPSMLRW